MKKTIAVVWAVMLLLFLSGIPSVSAHAAGSEMKIITNGYTVFLMKSDGTVMGWGRNSNGEVGVGNTADQTTPILIPELTNVNQIICGDTDSASFYAIAPDGGVLAWGSNQYGRLGLGNVATQSVPVAIPGLTGISQVITDGFTVYAITAEGNVYAWGRNNYGQVGNNGTNDQKTPVRITGLSNIESITCSAGVAYAIKNDKTVYAWGYGLYGQIGNKSFDTYQKTPIKISILSDISRIITNGSTTFAINSDGTKLYGWGYSPFGQVGCYSGSNQSQPVLITGISTVKDLIIAGGGNVTYAIMTDGSLYGWGQNMYGQLGNDGFFDRSYPLLISGVPGAKQLISSGASTCVLGTDNSVYTFGYNASGEVGNNQIGPQKTPYKIPGLNNISKIAGNGSTLFAITNIGTAYGWGQNYNAQTGIGWTGNQFSPVVIPGLTDVGDIQIFVSTTVFAKASNNKVYGWGSNRYGQLGELDLGHLILSPAEIIITGEENPPELATVTGSGNVNSVVPISGSIDALTISVTHPANVAYMIDPNIENGFSAADIKISNNSKVALRVSIESFRSAPGGTLQFTDVLPDSKNWDTLSVDESIEYIALGIQYRDHDEWLSPVSVLLNPMYAAEFNNTLIGELAKDASGSLILSAKHGLAFDREYIARHNLTFVFTLI